MTMFSSVNDPDVARILNAGGIGVFRTDTLYGVVAKAGDEAAVNRVYALKGRDDTKSPIVLIGSIEQLYDEVPAAYTSYFDTAWPGPVSVIVPSIAAPLWIRRGNESVAYRLPADAALQELLKSTGPLIAPSANPQGLPPALSISEAQSYFGADVDFYVNGGSVEDAQPSKLIMLSEDGEVTRLR